MNPREKRASISRACKRPTTNFCFFLLLKIRVYKRNNEELFDASLFLFFVDPLLEEFRITVVVVFFLMKRKLSPPPPTNKILRVYYIGIPIQQVESSGLQ